MATLLATKFHRPSIPPERVSRPRLIERLDEGLTFGRPVTLVSAPAGFGKTVCVSQWVDGLEDPVTWLSLDPADDDPGRFFTYLVAALQAIDENIGNEIEAVLRAGQLPPTEIISTALINDILDQEELFVLVLDDLQVIQDQVILHVLEDIVTNPPEPLHLVLLTREDPPLPLARLRGNNQLTEIRAADLRFSSSEAETFLNEVMRLALPETDISSLQMKTEGWVVGLQLAGLSIRDRELPSEFIATLRGSHRYILSYLTEEVLNLQPVEIRRFLLRTSILDRLNGELCDAVTQRTDSHVLLEQLYNANLFLIPLDDEGHWYRYHQLFADLLQDLLVSRKTENSEELHRRASRWYLDEGMISEAIEHAIAGEDYVTAVGLIERHAMDMLMQWHLKTVEGWMSAFPVEWVASSPSANLAFAWMHIMRNEHALAAPFLQRLVDLFADPETMRQVGKQEPALEAKLLALQSMMFNAQGLAEKSLELCDRALTIAPENDALALSMIYLGQAGAFEQLEEHDRATKAYHAIINLGQAAENSITELVGISALGLLALKHGQYSYAYQIVGDVIQRIENSGAMPGISTALYGELGVIHYQWCQLAEAHENFRRAIQVSTLSGYNDAEVFYGVILSRLHQIQGDLDSADREIRKAIELAKVLRPAAVEYDMVAQKVRIDLASGRLTEAESVLMGHSFSFVDGFYYPPLETVMQKNRQIWVLYLAALRVVIYRAQAREDRKGLNQAIGLAGNLIDFSLPHGYIPFVIETLILRAKLYDALGDQLSSKADYLYALELAQEERFISMFVEEGQVVAEALGAMLGQEHTGEVNKSYIREILDAFSKIQADQALVGGKEGYPVGDHVQVEPDSQPPIGEFLYVEPLTEREQDVLRLVADGLTYNEIAERLVVSLNTVRSHVKSIYGKLGVNNRTKAIEKARNAGIL